MDIEKMTVRVQKSLNDAYNEAVKHHNQQVDVIHLFSALVPRRWFNSKYF